MWEIPGLFLAILYNNGYSFIISISLCLLVFIAALYVYNSVHFVAKDEQLHIERLTDIEVITGPDIIILDPFIKKAQKKKVTSLSLLDYVIVRNSFTGAKRIVRGPGLVFLQPYDEPSATKQVVNLTPTEYIRLRDNSTGTVRVVRGPGVVCPEVEEVYHDGVGKKKAVDLKSYEYIRVEDKKTGEIRVEKGEQLVFLGATEEFVGTKQAAVDIDDNTAVLIRNKRTGQETLKKEKMAFIPSSDEEIICVRELIKLSDYQACIVMDKDGKETIMFGKNPAQRSFFLEPFATVRPLKWSRGRRRDTRDLIIEKVDLRPQYMSFEFNCRTTDNVELILEGSFFWEVADLHAMNMYTSDTTGDVCNHARSKFIARVAKVTLQEFMHNVQKIAQDVYNDDSSFYKQRGVLIHSLEVTGYRCADYQTSEVLGQIIQETTNRMNRLQKQESENEVTLASIQGEVAEAKAKGELLLIQKENDNLMAKTQGVSEASKIASFLHDLEKDLPDLVERIKVWNVLRKKDALAEIGQSSAQLFYTPNDVDLKIEAKMGA